VIPNATEDHSRFADNPFVSGDFHLRFHAAAPLYGPNGKPIGALGLIDTEPREFSAKQIDLLKKVAVLLSAEINS
jgi:GAF domain-containing protein